MITGPPIEPLGARWGANNRRLVNTAQAAAIAGIARRTLYLWIKLGRVEVTRTASGQLRIYADTLFRRDPRGRKPKSATGADA